MPGHGGRQGRAQERDLGVPVSHLLLLMLLQLLRLLRGLKRKGALADIRSRPSGLLALKVEGVSVVLKGRRGTTVVVRGQRGWDGAETVIVMILSNGKRVFYLHLIL